MGTNLDRFRGLFMDGPQLQGSANGEKRGEFSIFFPKSLQKCSGYRRFQCFFKERLVGSRQLN